MAIAESTSPAATTTPPARKSWSRARPVVFALIVPALLLAFWQIATTNGMTMLNPPTPYQVGEYMIDFAVGGIYDDAYSGTLLTHLLASMSRVYGGFAIAAAWRAAARAS